MKFSHGNEKLGYNCYVISRPVSDTCPKTCPFLNFGCYAEKTEKRFPNARKAGFNNLFTTKEDVKQLIQKALDKNKSIRLMERGDWLLNDKIDYAYLNTWKEALHEFTTLPNIWGYSHVPHRDISDLNNYGIKMYLSVHSEKDVIKGLKADFSLFAYIIPEKKKKGGSKNHSKKVDVPILGNVLVCPEQIHGRSGNKAVTCTGGKGTIPCTLCCRGFSNIVFLTH